MQRYYLFILCLSIFFPLNLKSESLILTDSSWQVIGIKGFSNGEANLTQLACDHSDTLFIAFYGGTFGQSNVMKFDGINWINTGLTQLSFNNTLDLSLAINPSNEPCLAYSHGSASVVRFDGQTWHYIGSPNFFPGYANGLSLAFDSSGQPFVAFAEGDNPNKASVMKFNGTAWEFVGQRGFLDSCYFWISIAISPDNEPWIATLDKDSFVTVMKFDGTNWTTVGNGVYSYTGWFGRVILKFNAVGQPFVLFSDDTRFIKVIKLENDYWVMESPLYQESDSYSMDFNLDNKPVIAFMDYNNSDKTTVLQSNGVEWNPIGPYGFSDGSSSYQSIVFNSMNQAYVSYQDVVHSNFATVMTYKENAVGEELHLENQLNTYPNPTDDFITINFPISSNSIKKIEIYNIDSKIIRSFQSKEGKIKLDVQSYPTGIYFINIDYGGSIYHGKFLKN